MKTEIENIKLKLIKLRNEAYDASQFPETTSEERKKLIGLIEIIESLLKDGFK